MPAGRPTLLTPELIRQAAALLPRALYVETVAAQLGVTAHTFRAWMRSGAKERVRREQGKAPDPKLDLHCEFSTVIKKASADAEADFLSCVQAAGTQSWQALAWVLERRFPQRWATNRGELRELAKQIARISTASATGGGKNAESDPQPEPPRRPPGSGDRGGDRKRVE